jgi:hypothetical protein
MDQNKHPLEPPKRDSAWPMSPRSSIRYVQTDFQACGTFDVNCAPILHQDYHCPKTELNELPLEPHYLAIPSCASKMISYPVVCLAQIVPLSFTDTKTDMTHVT